MKRTGEEQGGACGEGGKGLVCCDGEESTGWDGERWVEEEGKGLGLHGEGREEGQGYVGFGWV